MKWTTKAMKQILIGFVGWAILLLGLVMIPYPGPGWIVVFVGLSILATEFTWARHLHEYGHEKYEEWKKWLSRQPIIIKALFWTLTTVTIIVTIWLLNGYGLMNDWFDLNQDWVRSPFFK